MSKEAKAQAETISKSNACKSGVPDDNSDERPGFRRPVSRVIDSSIPQHKDSLFGNPWVHQVPVHTRHKLNVIAYTRYTDDPWDAGRQLAAIQKYCSQHDYRLVKVFEEAGRPSGGLSRALEALQEADALIAFDLDRFVEHEGDRMRDLRPFIHDFFGLKNKRLITIQEGIDTGSPSGQMDAIGIINERRNHGLNMP